MIKTRMSFWPHEGKKTLALVLFLIRHDMSLKAEPHQAHSLSGFILGQTVAGHEENHNKNQARPIFKKIVQMATKVKVNRDLGFRLDL